MSAVRPRHVRARIWPLASTALLVIQVGFAQPVVASSAVASSRPQETSTAPDSVTVDQVAAKPNELVDRRTPSSDTVDNGDGTLTTTLYSEQVYYQPSGAPTYLPVQVGFAPVNGDPTAVASTNAPVGVEVEPATSADGFLTVTTGGHQISYRPASPALLSPAADQAPATAGAAADLAEAIPGVGARILARADGAHVFFVANSAADAAELTYEVDAPGLSLAPDKNGGYTFSDAIGGVIARMPNPYAVDSTPDGGGLGSGHTTDKVNYQITGSASPYTVTVSVDPDWLKGAVYPVYVDPTITNGGGNTYGDTFVNPGNASFEYGNYCRPDSPYYCEMWLGQSPSPTSDVGTDYIRFDLSSIAGTTIDTATLKIYPYWQYYHTTGVNTWVRQVASSGNWSESATNYSNRPSANASPIITGNTTQSTWSSFNVLSIVRNWIHSGQTNNGFQVDENGNNYTYWKRVISAEETGFPHAEQLVVTNHVPTATVVSPTGWTASKTVTWTYADSQGAAQSHYHVDVASDSGFGSIIATSGDVASAATSYTFTATLTAGSTYYWRVKVKNGTSWSAFASHSFMWDPSAPAIGAFTQPASNPTYVKASTWQVAWPLVTSASGISSLVLHQDSGPVVTPGTCADATETGTTSFTLATNATSYTAGSGTTGTCYWYWLVATNGVGTQTTGPTSKPVLYDTTLPGIAFGWPPAGVTTTAINPVVAWTETESGSGVATRSLQRQVTTVTGPGTCGTTWTNNGTPYTTPSPVAQTTSVGSCYRWQLTVTDAAGNQTLSTSGSLIRDATADLGRLPYQRFESWSIGAGDGLSVNVGSGNLVLSHPIASLPIRGSSVDLALVYNSQDPANIGVGAGWRLNVQRRLTLNADSSVTFIGSDGARYAFTNPQTVGTVTTYTRPVNVYAVLVKDTSLAHPFTLTYRDQSKDRFDILASEAILKRIDDRFGNGVDLSYVGSTNQISAISDTAGSRAISFGWTSGNLTSITDWANVNGSGVVQTSGSGNRTTRLFYSGANLTGWADPLNTSATCPTGGGHVTCLTYTSGLVTAIAKTQTVTTAGATALGSSTRVITTQVTHAGSDVATVKDAEQVSLGGSGVATSIGRTTPTTTTVTRPTTTTLYGLVAADDDLVRMRSVWRRFVDPDTQVTTDIEQRTTYDATFRTEPASITENYGALLGTPAVARTYTYVTGSLGLLQKLVEPLTASPATNRWTEYTYNANNDVLTKKVSQDGSSAITTKFCYTTDCTANTGLTLVKEIDNYVSAGPQDDETNVTTDFAYDAYGQQTRATRHNHDASGTDLDDRATGFVYDSLGDQTAQIENYQDGVVTNGTSDTIPDATGARTDLTTTYGYDTAGNRVSAANPRRAIGLAVPATTTATFNPTDDAHVRDANPTTNYGSDPILETRLTGGSQGSYEPYLKFTVTGIVGNVTGATLRLTNTQNANKSTRNVCLYRVASSTWTEGAITDATKPAGDASSLICVHGDQAAGQIDYVLPATAVTGPGIYAFKLTNDTTFDVDYSSREGANAPQLLVTVSYGPLGSDDFVDRSTFDALNQAVSAQTPNTFGLSDKKTSSSVFDELGSVRQAADTGGVVTGIAFDRVGRSTATYEDTDGAGGGAPTTTATTTYDADGQMVSEKDRKQVGSASLGATTHQYDSLGRETIVTEAAGSSPDASSETATTYDALDHTLTSSVAGQDTTYGYDLGGRRVKTDDGFACTTSSFDFRDLNLTTTDGLAGGTCASGANTRTVTNSFDGLARRYRAEVTSGTGIGDRTQDDTLDSVGNKQTSATRTSGVTSTTTFIRNDLDEVTGEARPDGTTAKVTFDPAGNPTDQCTWNAGVTVGACQVVGSVPWSNPPSQSTSTTYDAQNQRVQLVDGTTNATTIYDPNHKYQVSAIYTPTASGHELQALYGYDNRHRLQTIAIQLCTLSGSGHGCAATVAMGSDTYAYDDNDNRTRVNESNGASSLDRYYCDDARNQLTTRGTGSGCAGADETYTYDDAGNRLTAPANAFTYSTDGQLTGCTTGCGTVTYDTAGRTSRLNGWAFLYDSEGRLISACQATSCTGSGFNRVDWTYDGEGHRTKQVETSSAGAMTTTVFTFAGDHPVGETTTSATGTVTRSFVTDDSGRINKVTIADAATPANNGAYLVTWNGHGDALGLWRQAADGTLSLANSFTYGTWGTAAVTLGPGFNDLGFRYRYVGASDVESDTAFGLDLLYMHARTYSPTIGRFLQPDPSRAENNLYAYAGNDPTSRVDPAAEESIWVVCALNPNACAYHLVFGSLAINYAIDHFGARSSHGNGRGDACRHCIWQALMTRVFGTKVARAFGNSNENLDSGRTINPESVGSPYLKMDLNNNEQGRLIGLRARWNGYGAAWILRTCEAAARTYLWYTVRGRLYRPVWDGPTGRGFLA